MNAALDTPGVSLRTEHLISLRALALRSRSNPVLAALPGGYATRVKGQGLEVADLREYVTGDDIRHLDRATTARTGRLHVRQFQAERDRVSLLVADLRGPMFWGLRRAFLSVAASEALVLEGWPIVEGGGRVALLAVTDTGVVVVPPRGRVRGMLDVIGGLVEAHARGLDAMAAGQGAGIALDQALARATRLVPAGSEILIASGFDNPGTGLAERLEALARRRSPRLLWVTETRSLPTGRYPVRMADGRHMRLNVGENAGLEDEATIAGHSALVLDAGAPLEDMAGRLAGQAQRARAA